MPNMIFILILKINSTISLMYPYDSNKVNIF